MSIYKRLLALLLAMMLTAGCAFASAEPTEAPDDENAEIAEVPAEEEAPVSEDESTPAADAVTPTDASEGPADDTASAEPESLPWQTPGNTDSEILNGGLFLYTDDGFYFSDGGIWYRSGTADRFVCAGDAMNLNLSDGLLYFTCGSVVYRVSPAGGDPEVVTSFDTDITELYVIGQELRFLACGCVYSYSMTSGTLTQLDAPADVTGLIPTEYGNLYLTGSVFSRTLWAGTACAMTDIERCYTDNGMLVIIADGQTLQADPAALFAGDYSASSYTLHQDMAGGSGMTDEQEASAQEDYFASADYQALQSDISVTTDGIYLSKNSSISWTAQSSGTLTADQQNLITRARLMAELTWTAAANLTWWSGTKSGTTTYSTDGTASYSTDSSHGTFLSGKTYQGAPYSQPVTNNGYIGWDISLNSFLTAAAKAGSLLYTTRSDAYAGSAGPYYGIDCSGFVSYAWDLSSRRTVSHLRDSDVAQYISPSLQNLQVGDTLNRDGVHVLLVTDLAYDKNGSIISVEITEQVPPKTKVTCYGEVIPGRSYEYTGELSTLAAYLTNYNYSIYRRVVSTAVSAPDTSAVDLDAAVRDISATGWTQYHNATYYFNAYGEMLTSTWLQYNGSVYYLGYDGKMVTSAWQWDGSSFHYLCSDGKMAVSTILNINGTNYVFDASGNYSRITAGWLWLNGSFYYFDTSTAIHTGWLSYSGSWYYMDSTGKMVTGIYTIPNDATYSFSSGGAMNTNCWLWQDGYFYYFGGDGRMLRNSWLSYGGSWYFMGSDGRMVTGVYDVPNDTAYYFSAGGAMNMNCWLWQGGYFYYFGSDGRMVKNNWVWYSGSWYYMGTDGKMLAGSTSLDQITEIGGSSYAFGSSGAMLTSTWILRNNNWYYFGSDGRMVKNNWAWYGGSWYYFDSQGRMLCLSGITGTDLIAIYTIGTARYGFNASGVMCTYWGQTVDGSRYYFGTSGYAYTSQWLWDNSSFYYFGSDSKMYKNQWLEYGGAYYYFDANGKMLTSTTTPDGYQVDSSGRRV